MNQVEERLNIVESALAEFIIQSNRSLHRLEREMLAFKDEMRAFKNEMQEDRRKMNKQWGELANKMGTLVEDIVAPAVRPAIQKHFQEEVLDIMVSRKKYDKQKGLRGEFDVIAITDTSVYLVDSKMSPNKEKLLEFKNKVVPRFRQLFPEYKKLQMVPIFAALRFDQELVDFGTKEKVYMLAYREWDYMDILDFEALKTK